MNERLQANTFPILLIAFITYIFIVICVLTGGGCNNENTTPFPYDDAVLKQDVLQLQEENSMIKTRLTELNKKMDDDYAALMSQYQVLQNDYMQLLDNLNWWIDCTQTGKQ